jgi:hypothetical protein
MSTDREIDRQRLLGLCQWLDHRALNDARAYQERKDARNDAAALRRLLSRVEELEKAVAIYQSAMDKIATIAAQGVIGAPEASERVAGALVRTAPQRIYLLVSDDDEHYGEPFPDCSGDEVTWSVDPALACHVAYVRADLVDAPRDAAPADVKP